MNKKLAYNKFIDESFKNEKFLQSFTAYLTTYLFYKSGFKNTKLKW